jgi:hypothetical protein
MSNNAADAGSRRNPDGVMVIVAPSSGFGGPAGTAGGVGVGATGAGGLVFWLAHATVAASSAIIKNRLNVIFSFPQPRVPSPWPPTSNPCRNPSVLPIPQYLTERVSWEDFLPPNITAFAGEQRHFPCVARTGPSRT